MNLEETVANYIKTPEAFAVTFHRFSGDRDGIAVNTVDINSGDGFWIFLATDNPEEGKEIEEIAGKFLSGDEEVTRRYHATTAMSLAFGVAIPWSEEELKEADVWGKQVVLGSPLHTTH